MGWKGASVRGKLVLALVLLMLSVAVASDGNPFNLNDPATWMPIAAAIIIIHLTLVSILYMVASTFQDEQLKAWGKNEVMQAVFSAIIIASIGATIAIFDNEIIQPFFADVVEPECNPSTDPLCHQLRTDLKYDPSSNRWKEGDKGAHITVDDNRRVVCKGLQNCDPKFLMARSYLGITYEKLAKVLEHFIYDYSIYTALDSMGFNFGMSWTWKIEPPPIIGFNIGGSFPNHAILINTLDNCIHFIERLMMLIKFQESVLKFFEYGLAATLIVLGILLRSIWLFRKAGGLFIAMGLCFMFVLPTLYAIGWYTIDIPPFAEISKQPKEVDQSLLEEALNATGVSSIVDFIEKAGEVRGDMGTMNAVIAVVMSVVTAGFITLRVLEASQIKTTVPAAIKAILDTIVIGSMMATFVSMAWLHVVDADDLYTTSLDDPGYLDIISRYAIVAIALPLLNFYITFSFIRGMSPLFGGDAEIPGLSRLL